MKIKNSLKKVMVALSVLFAVTLFTATAYADTMCRQTGNVECSRQDGNAGYKYGEITFTFTNYNAYQVTVNADFSIVGESGSATPSNTIVIPANGTKTVKFTQAQLGIGLIERNACTSSFSVYKCD